MFSNEVMRVRSFSYHIGTFFDAGKNFRFAFFGGLAQSNNWYSVFGKGGTVDKIHCIVYVWGLKGREAGIIVDKVVKFFDHVAKEDTSHYINRSVEWTKAFLELRNLT